MTIINVINVKCGGCEKSITEKLEENGFEEVQVNVEKQTVSFEKGDAEKAKEILNKMGYPERTSNEAKSLLKKAKSYLSCIIGKTKK
jgi:copper chaperone CopZ